MAITRDMDTRAMTRSATGSNMEPRRLTPIKWWALAGVVFLGIAAWSWGGWIFSGQATPTPHGPTPIPDYIRIAARIVEVLFVIMEVAVIYLFLIKPWRREGHITFDGMLLIACTLLWWQDPLGNYFKPVVTYNSVFFNLGSWSSNIPGWISPNGNLFAEPLIFASGAYLLWTFGLVILTSVLMRKARARWPRVGTFGLVMGLFVPLVVMEFALEIIAIRFQLFTYAGGSSHFTIFAGTRFQIPWWEAHYVMAVVAMAAIRFLRDDRGRTVVERGIDRLQVTGKRRQFVRFLALCGVLNVLYLGLCMGPQAFWGAHGAGWPQDLQNRSYLTDLLCGPGTEYACPGSAIPAHTRSSAHIGPDGTLIVPPGEELPSPY